MKEKLLFDWKQKYERIQWELKDNDKKLEKVINRQKNLVGDIIFQIGFMVVSFLVMSFLVNCREYVGGWLFGYAFYPLYILVVGGFIVGIVIYNISQLVKRIKRYRFHVRQGDDLKYPKPETVDSNYPLHIPSNYYAERKCIEWLLHQYTEETMQLIALRRKIENTPEQNLEPLWEELDCIVIYERVGCAKG